MKKIIIAIISTTIVLAGLIIFIHPTKQEIADVLLSPEAIKISESSIGHATNRIGNSDLYPDDQVTPGMTNPDVTQATISETICNPNWSTKSIRPSASYTTALKIKQLKASGAKDKNTSHYEEDHYISLELGGNPTDSRNLWPEAYQSSMAGVGAKTKDVVENYLHKRVCEGNITLLDAQQAITSDWYQIYLMMAQSPNLGAPVISDDPDDN